VKIVLAFVVGFALGIASSFYAAALYEDLNAKIDEGLRGRLDS
jgi:hypothetical protein